MKHFGAPDMVHHPALEVIGLGKSYQLHLQGGLVIEVLRDISLRLNAGQCLAITGPSGAGKSTLLRCLVGNARSDAGQIWLKTRTGRIDIAGADERTLLRARRETIAWVSQFLRAIPRVATIDIVSEPLLEDGIPLDEARDRAQKLLTRLNLPERLWNLPPATFSGGEQQRVNLARGLIRPRALLLLDEPTASLDLENRDRVVGLIREAKVAGAAVIGIFHDTMVRDAVADHVFEVLPLTNPVVKNHLHCS